MNYLFVSIKNRNVFNLFKLINNKFPITCQKCFCGALYSYTETYLDLFSITKKHPGY